MDLSLNIKGVMGKEEKGKVISMLINFLVNVVAYELKGTEEYYKNKCTIY